MKRAETLYSFGFLLLLLGSYPDTPFPESIGSKPSRHLDALTGLPDAMPRSCDLALGFAK
jgi:hypothetical protein